MATFRTSVLLDLGQRINAFAISEDEIVATVASLVNSGQVRRCGNFAGARIDLPILVYAASKGLCPRESNSEFS